MRALAAIWVRAEWVRELVIAAADRRPAADWRILRDLASEAGARLTLVVERRASSDHLAELGDDVRELTLSELVEKLPVAMPADEWGLFDESGSPDDRPGYPPVPDVDFALFPSACVDLLPEHDAARVLRAFERARGATMLWLELRCGIEDRHGPSPRHAHAFLDTLVAPCATIDGAITSLRGAQAAFLLDGTLLEIDPDAFAVDHQSHAGAPATNATATTLRSYPEPHLVAAGALASATRANPDQIAGLTLASVARVDASFTSGHRIKPPFQPLLAAQALARRAVGADDAEPLFLAPDNSRPATPRHVRNWLARIGRETSPSWRFRGPTWASRVRTSQAKTTRRRCRRRSTGTSRRRSGNCCTAATHESHAATCRGVSARSSRRSEPTGFWIGATASTAPVTLRFTAAFGSTSPPIRALTNDWDDPDISRESR